VVEIVVGERSCDLMELGPEVRGRMASGMRISDLERSISGAGRSTVAVEATVSASDSSVGRLLWSFSGRPAEQ
jgi:hypothetical protein